MAKAKKAEGKVGQGKPAGSKPAASKPGNAKHLKAKAGTGKSAAAKATPKAKTRGGPVKAAGAGSGAASKERLIPGQYFLRSEPIVANADRTAIEVKVENAGDRPVQVGSHFHFFEVNRALHFDRKRAYGMRLDIPAGTAVRFEPGQAKNVALIPLGGERHVWGLNGLVNGPLS